MQVSGPVVVADGMAGAAMYELSSRTFLSILASTLKLLSSSGTHISFLFSVIQSFDKYKKITKKPIFLYV